MEAWNGTTWTLVPMPLPGGEGGGLFGATCVNGSDCWAVGAVVGSGSGNPTGTLIEQWNGTSWSVGAEAHPERPGRRGRHPLECELRVGIELHGGWLCDGCSMGTISPTSSSSGTDPAGPSFPAAATGQAFDQLISVQCLSAANCWAVGNAGPASQMSGFLPIFPGAVGDQGLIEHWDGSAWSIVPSVTEPAPERRLPERPRVRRCHRLLGLRRNDRRQRERRRGSSWSTGMGARGADASASVPGSTAPGMLAGISCVSAAAVLGRWFHGIIQQRRLGRAAAELGGVLERVVVVGGAQSERHLPQLPQLGELRDERRLPG